MAAVPENISPHVYVLSTFTASVTTLALFNHFGFENNWFLLPVVLLALFYGIANLRRQTKGISKFVVARKIHWGLLLKRALARYAVWLTIIFLGSVVYRNLPYYGDAQFTANFLFFDQLLYAVAIFGIPYFALTLIIKSSPKEDFYDPAVRIIHIAKQLLRHLGSEEQESSPRRVFRNVYNRKVLLNLVVRFYFIPVMIVQVLSNLLMSTNLLDQAHTGWTLWYVLTLISAVLWLMDIINASVAYCFESRWLENRSRSIDLTFTGWLVCLACYQPLNQATGYAFFFAPFVATGNPQDLVYNDSGLLLTIKILEIVFLASHIYSGTSLGPSVANITLKRLQTRGPFGLVRHPGTTTKLLFWLSQSMFYRNFWTLKVVFGYLMWAAIYIARALTEERHLKQFPEYREYMRKVKHRFLPWLF
jgi:protein-S-isoprenylcysteine O-methyltransferase Ste14